MSQSYSQLFIKKQWVIWVICLGFLLLSACNMQQFPNSTSVAITEIQEQVILTDTPQFTPTSNSTATSTFTPIPSLTPTYTNTPLPTATPSPTQTPTQTSTPSPTPTPTHPLMIEVMRQQSYPGSEIVFEQTLDPGLNYERYLISYQSEGNKIFALLTVPWGDTPPNGWPVIIFNHGYIPPAQYRTTERYVAYVDGFARNGYIVLRSDYRGHGSSEGEATGGYGSPAYTIDVLNAVAAIKQYSAADPNRIGMWGHSMGGQITLRAMVVSSDIKAGVIWAGVVASYPDLIERWRRRAEENPTPTPNPNSRRGRWRRELMETYGSYEDNPDFWNAISPNSYLSDLSGPIQLHHGTADHSVPFEFSEILHEEMEAANQVVELYIYDGDDHNIATNFSAAMQQSLIFFNTYVKDVEN